MNDFATTLLNWFGENRRDLPWRHTADPYAIWLSEVILQQTRIQQGTAYWERFMQKWATVEQLAAADEGEVLKAWQGLGYYSRARNLHAAARQVVERGKFPDTFEDIKQLKGVGDYTAAAIASIAFGLPCAVVDGNVYRVLSRYFGITTPINSTEGKKEFAALAQELIAPLTGRKGNLVAAYNQALMDFGAIQCTPLSPRCLLCPLQEGCAALRTGRVAQLPVKLRKLKIKEQRLTYVYIRCNGETAIHQRGAGNIWQGLWEPYAGAPQSLPTPHQTQHTPAPQSLPTPHQTQHPPTLTLLKKDMRHVLTHRILLADFYLLECEERPLLPPDYIWIRESDIEDYAVPRLIERMLEMVGNHSPESHR